MDSTKKYIVELIGTFFLVLTIGCTVIPGAAGVIAPLAIDGPQLTIRKFTQRVLTLEDLVRLGTRTSQVGDWITRELMGRPHA